MHGSILRRDGGSFSIIPRIIHEDIHEEDTYDAENHDEEIHEEEIHDIEIHEDIHEFSTILSTCRSTLGYWY